ncbi:ABC transporter ATP-binding protein [Methanolobus profundi]|uniref:ABC-2 type transport system ATP-binding protein n=1 Tax=Methanolobus profundi TaxID=487685 RepID=A0A1I4R9G5_9EURY|nr:ABC transporter ATP-binding protein [Methanolobus profundi]SFM48825.1 ABC-2 type transport system ATP-binding protein [Methanolobus profundi]
MEPGIIEVNGLRKEYGDFVAVDNLSFSVSKGQIFGIVGPNGAGKTTTLKMLSSLIRPTSGNIYMKGLDVSNDSVEIKSFLGFLPEESPLYESMGVEDYLMFFAELYSVPKDRAKKRIRELLFDLALNADGKKIGDLSKGMKRKVAIARSLINDPDILIYDEPASGLDPMTSRYITDYVRSLKSSGKTIIFTAHNLYQVESLCDRILILKNGKLVTLGTAEEIRKEYGKIQYRLEFKVDNIDGYIIADFKDMDGTYVVITNDINVVNQTTKWVASEGGDIVEMRTIVPSLEEIFLELMGVELFVD